MVEHAREALAGERATVLEPDLTELELDEPVDAAFSNAVFHWIPRPRRAVRAPARRAQAGRRGWWRSAAARATSTASARLARRGGRRAALRGAHGGFDRALELRRRRGDARRGCERAGFDEIALLAAALAGRRRDDPLEFAQHRLPRQPPPGAAGGAARARFADAVVRRWASRSSSTTSGSTSTPKSPARAQETVQYRTFVRRLTVAC